ncbi:MAG: Gfo/Idh/MocA family oxidoreductase [Oscillospiraceae bacterium]|jgi:predicted dehydrogenase|uniref:Gfo/Idh/MocA family oxidoreductase n=1 Tax=Caproicibacterium lactatifermentans TaxID=2666138 RepID=A0A859DTT6_9FIRM|nr:Gfo/Idh/MocA family oxidoreductase [Caproicibacterium lactatifermentans]MDD4808188.1 Gfo/Idh/MocA family oxidoreductase [Oscillospiraceae bacterium]QKN23431.1 gfo/Idh/MocA family oxidoreductase [Caproicibacterium lactatifermentans]
MAKLRFMLIGCGRISKNHIAAAAANKDTMTLAVVCDVVRARAEEKAAMLKEQAGYEPLIYTDYKKALQEQEIDVCAIATESGFHAQIALECMAHGKHVLTEKPMALSTADAEKMISTAEAKGLTLGVCHQNRFNAPIQQLHAALDAGRFGKLVSGTARILWNRNMSYYQQAPWRGTWAQDGGTLMNQCIHNIDLLQWSLGGEPDTVMAMTGNYLRDIQAEDFGAVLIRFKNGAIGIVEGTACVYPKNLEETLSVFGETGCAVIGGLAVNRIETWNFAEPAPQDEVVKTLVGKDPKDVYGSGHNALYANYIHAVNTHTRPLVSGYEGIKALKIILAAYQSQKTGKAVKFDGLSFATTDMCSEDVKVR